MSPSFPQDPRGYMTKGVIRTPYLTSPPLTPGWDVWALQSALNWFKIVPPLVLDGSFGPKTDEGVKAVQKVLGLVIDGRVGPVTYAKTTAAIAVPLRKKYNVLIGLLYGQAHHESWLIHGNYSPRHEDDLHFDNGVVQENGRYWQIEHAMTVPQALEDLAKNLRDKFDDFRRAYPNITDRRCWECACADWNSPQSARALASGTPLDPEEKTRIEEYVTDCFAYVR